MQFQFYPLRFEFVAHESLYFPPGKAANTLRGAMGIISRKIACRPECQDARTCEVRQSCAYAQIFEPGAQEHVPGPTGLADWPRPFVFRARHLDNRSIQAGESFYFDLHVFTLDPGRLSHFVQTFTEFAREGLGPSRVRVELQRVCTRAIGDVVEQPISASTMPTPLDLEPRKSAPSGIRVDFLSPTELKHENKIAGRPEFPILFGRVRDRISTLRALYGGGPLDIDFRAMGERAASVRMTRCEVSREEAGRRSTRTGQTHSIGGFVGFAEYEGPLAEFLPYLEVARWTGVGRQAVWGKGEIAVTSPAPVPNSAATH
jgi:hypothetical protein